MIVEAVKSFLMPQRVIQMHRAAARDHKHIRDAGCEKLFCYIIRKFLFHFDFLLKIPCQVFILHHKNVFSPVHSRTRAIALYRPASHGCSFLNGARKEYVCFAAAFFSSALIISHFVCPFLFFINLHPDFLSSIPIACTQKFSPENITFPKTKSVIFPILKFFYFPSTQIDFFVG